jgi:hypothetical protein
MPRIRAVNAPRLCLNSSLSSSVSLITDALKKNGSFARGEELWIAWTSSVLPVPVRPTVYPLRPFR